MSCFGAALCDFTMIGGPVSSRYRITCVYILGHVLIINTSINHLNQSCLLRGPGNIQNSKSFFCERSASLKDSCSTYTFSWHLVESSPIVKTWWRTRRLTDFSKMDKTFDPPRCFSTNKFRFLSLVSCLFDRMSRVCNLPISALS